MTTSTAKNEPEFDERFKFGPAPIQTAEDATMAYLREEITEEEYRAACGKFGVLPGTIMQTPAPNRPDRVDAAFHREIPDDIFLDKLPPEVDLEAKLEEVEAKQKLREAATEETRKREEKLNVPVGPNLTADEAHKLEEKILVPHLAANKESDSRKKAEKSSAATPPKTATTTSSKSEVKK